VVVSDFGLSRSGADTYESKGTKMPIRWTAVEIFKGQPYTSASDVWSFGVVCWEVFSSGMLPWSWLSNQEVTEAITRGERLKKPDKCPDDLWGLILQCWSEHPTERPTFAALLKKLNEARRTVTEIQSARRISTEDEESPHENLYLKSPEPNLTYMTNIV